jgi:hypothetical protein
LGRQYFIFKISIVVATRREYAWVPDWSKEIDEYKGATINRPL